MRNPSNDALSHFGPYIEILGPIIDCSRSIGIAGHISIGADPTSIVDNFGGEVERLWSEGSKREREISLGGELFRADAKRRQLH